jgi:importin subunit beta-1
MIEDDEKVSIQAFEFWCSISDEEKLRTQNSKGILQYSERALNTLIEVINYHLLNRNKQEDDDDFDSWNTVKASSSLLENLSQCTSDTLITEVFNFIGKYLTSQDPKIRDSALLAFGSILPSQSQALKQTIPDALQTILPLLSDTNSKVKTTVAWCMKKICQHHSSCFAGNDSLLDKYMRALYDNLHNKARVVIYLCDSLHHLALYLQTVNNSIMSNYIPGFCQELLKIAFMQNAYEVENNIALASIFTMGTLVDTAPPESYEYLLGFFPSVVNAFESTLAGLNNFSTDEMRLAYQGYIATLISSFILERKVALTQDQAEHLFGLFKQTFGERGCIYEEGIMTLSSLALAIGPAFLPLVKDFGGYLTYGLENWSDASICRICINGVSDLIRALREDMEPYIGHLMEKILKILEVNNI